MSTQILTNARQRVSLACLLATSCFGSCTSVPLAQLCPVEASSFENGIGLPRRPKIDILLVIDNSEHMAAKQAALAATFGELLRALTYERADFDYHIGITSTDVGSWVAPGQPWTQSAGACDSFAGDDGRLQATSCLDRQSGAGAAARACSTVCPERQFVPTDGTPFLSRHNGVSNVPVSIEPDPRTGNMIDRGPEHALSCMALLGESGCTLSSPLEAMKRALDGHLPGNRDFLRKDSILQIFILTDKDDCSVQAARRQENDPRTRNCTTADATAGYDCYNPSFRCLARNLECDQPLNIAGNKTGCRERPDTYLQPLDDYVRFLAKLHSQYYYSVVGLWATPSIDTNGQLVVTQDPNVAGSSGLAAQAACQAQGSPSFQAQPQDRLGHLKAMLDVGGGWSAPLANICEPQSYEKVITDAESWTISSSVMSCVYFDSEILTDDTPNCLAGDVTFDQWNDQPLGQMPSCSASCCAAMPSPKNFDWSWSWDNATIAACTNEPVNCYCLTPAAYCAQYGGFGFGAWRAGNADLPPATGVKILCARNGSPGGICKPHEGRAR